MRPAARLAAALAATALLAGAGGYVAGRWTAAPPAIVDAVAAWREACVAAASRVTSQSLLALPQGEDRVARDLEAAGPRLGLDLAPLRTALPGLSLERVLLGRDDGAWIVEVDFLDPENGAVSLCLRTAPGPAAEVATGLRGGMTTASWASERHVALLVGRGPESVLAGQAARLATALRR